MKLNVTEILDSLRDSITEKDCVEITSLLIDVARNRSTLKKMLQVITAAYEYESSSL